MNGDSLARIAKNAIRKFGQPLTVTKVSDSTTQSIYFLPQPMNDDSFVKMGYEGPYNRLNDNPHNFVCAGDETIEEGQYKIAYDGDTYNLVQVNEQYHQGVAIRHYCIGVRIGPS